MPPFRLARPRVVALLANKAHCPAGRAWPLSRPAIPLGLGQGARHNEECAVAVALAIALHSKCSCIFVFLLRPLAFMAFFAGAICAFFAGAVAAPSWPSSPCAESAPSSPVQLQPQQPAQSPPSWPSSSPAVTPTCLRWHPHPVGDPQDPGQRPLHGLLHYRQHIRCHRCCANRYRAGMFLAG